MLILCLRNISYKAAVVQLNLFCGTYSGVYLNLLFIFLWNVLCVFWVCLAHLKATQRVHLNRHDPICWPYGAVNWLGEAWLETFLPLSVTLDNYLLSFCFYEKFTQMSIFMPDQKVVVYMVATDKNTLLNFSPNTQMDFEKSISFLKQAIYLFIFANFALCLKKIWMFWHV